MPELERPDGVRIHWQERGEGPLVLVLHHCGAHPGVYEGLADELARDCRVVTYDARGTGRSTRSGPYGTAADDWDLAAVVEGCGRDAVAVGFGDAQERAASVAVARPDLIQLVVSCGATPLGPGALGEVEGMSASPAVWRGIIDLASRSSKAAFRSLLELTNPGMAEDELRERLDATAEYCSYEALQSRLGRMHERDIGQAAALGDRFWVARWHSPFSPPDVTSRVRELLPAARVEEIAEGPISRPDLTAAVVRKAIATRAAPS
jgi:pimeloyl-ACP methyl ester carboxylesterase